MHTQLTPRFGKFTVAQEARIAKARGKQAPRPVDPLIAKYMEGSLAPDQKVEVDLSALPEMPPGAASDVITGLETLFNGKKKALSNAFADGVVDLFKKFREGQEGYEEEPTVDKGYELRQVVKQLRNAEYRVPEAVIDSVVWAFGQLRPDLRD